MNKPTEAQSEKFWKRYGVINRRVTSNDGTYQGNIGREAWFDADDNFIDFSPPHLDLNNLFKYVVQKLLNDGYEGLQELLEDWVAGLTFNYEENTLALFWALRQVRESIGNQKILDPTRLVSR